MSPEQTADRKTFIDLFGPGGDIRTVRAPGRVNLIGEHTDYNDGFVFPMAIEPHVSITCRARTDGKVRLASTVYPGDIVEFSVDTPIEKGQPKWANYSKGMAAQLQRAGIALTGMDALMSNTLPMGGGLSSSAALEVGTGRALLSFAGTDMDSQRLALLAQKAEHEFAGVPTGIMDQTIVAAGKVNHAMLLDCRDLSKRFVPIDGKEVIVVIVNSMVKHELSGGEYAERRHQCEAGVAVLQKTHPDVKALRDVTITQLEAAENEMEPIVYRRCRHVIGEIARTLEAADALAARRYDEFGAMMIASHNSLREDYEVSTAELDYLVEQSMTLKGVYGARMTGGGFGGSIVTLVQPTAVEPLRQHLLSVYPKQFKLTPDIFATTATAGAAIVA